MADDSMFASLARPQWAMIGCPGPPGFPCRLVASNNMVKGDLETKYDSYGLQGPWPVPLSGTVTIKLVMAATDKCMIIIDAQTWQQCIEELFKQWSPEHGKITRAEITMGQGELDG